MLNKIEIKNAKEINKSKRPLLVIGQGIILSNAENALLDFVKTDIPVSTLLGLGAFPNNHKNYVVSGMHGNYAPNIMTNE